MDPIMKAVKTIYSVTSTEPSVAPEEIAKERAGMDLFSKVATLPVGVSNEAFEVEGIPCEWVRPDRSRDRRHIIMYCHGGGYTCGSLKYARILAAKLAFHTGMDVLSFEYRLAPENTYPAAKEDAIVVWDYLMRQGFGAKDIFLAGDSAGGNLALELSLELKAENRFLPKALILFSPWTDMTATSETYESRKEQDPMLTREYVEVVRGAYVGERTDFDSIDFSPLYGDFSEFPPTLIQVGDNEILLDDSRNLHKRLIDFGVLSRIEVYDDGWHVFQQMPIPRASKAISSVADFVQEII